MGRQLPRELGGERLEEVAPSIAISSCYFICLFLTGAGKSMQEALKALNSLYTDKSVSNAKFFHKRYMYLWSKVTEGA